MGIVSGYVRVKLLRPRFHVYLPLLLAGALSCHRQGQAPAISIAEQERWRADSVDYGQRLERWRHDSLVIDSIARSINTDSLRALYRAVWNLPRADAANQELMCEQVRLNLRYGTLAGMLAGKKVQHEEWGTDDRKANQHLSPRLQHWDGVELSQETCHLVGSHAPETLNGTPLFAPTPRPNPPRRP